MGNVKKAKVYFPEEIEKIRVDKNKFLEIKFYLENNIEHFCLNEKQTIKLLKKLKNNVKKV